MLGVCYAVVYTSDVAVVWAAVGAVVVLVGLGAVVLVIDVGAKRG